MFLATTQELLEHFRYLRSSPSKAAALISPQADENSEQTKKLVLSQMKSEWELVLRLEGNPASACELHENCRYVSYHCFRELMAVWEKHAWTVHPEALSLTLAWYPEFAWSSNIESLFKEMTTAVKRSGQSDVGSLPNLMAVAIRGLHRRFVHRRREPAGFDTREGGLVWTPSFGTQAEDLQSYVSPTLRHNCNFLSQITRSLRSLDRVGALSVCFAWEVWSQSCLAGRLQGHNLSFDNISKPFPSTSAFHHCHHSLNYMAGLMLADSLLARNAQTEKV